MNELSMLKKELHPSEILFIADSMIGQDAVRSAGEFHKRLGLTGVILTKLDGDARGGAALSIAKVSGAPVKFVGLGEKYDALEGFYPERIVSRVLGMGDILSLIERAELAVDRKAAEELERKLRKSEFTLEDFRDRKKNCQSTALSKIGGKEHVRHLQRQFFGIEVRAIGQDNDGEMIAEKALDHRAEAHCASRMPHAPVAIVGI